VFGVFELNPNTRRLSSGKNSVALTPKQFGILHLLVQYVGRPLSREYIFSRMYDPAKDTDSRAVDVIVKKLRAKMQTLAEGNCIRTLHSAGYVVDPARMKKGGW
jgi:DNA-binding response OmpR family regulator